MTGTTAPRTSSSGWGSVTDSITLPTSSRAGSDSASPSRGRSSTKPDILLADEPTGNLDQDTGETILTELTRLKEDENVAIVAVTHDEQMLEYTDSTVRLVDGVVTEVSGR